MTKKIIRHIIQDEPSNKDLFHGRGHERTAHSLSKAIVKFDKGDCAIGLDGSWGSGKSSVVEMAARKLSEKNEDGKKIYHFFTFDIWKSQGSGFRRSYLEHFITWAKQEFPKKHAELSEIESQIQGKTREIQTNNQPILDWYGISVLVFLPFLPLYYFWAKKVFDDVSKSSGAVYFLCTAPFIILIGFVAATLALAFFHFNADKKKGKKADFKATISRLLLISSKQHQDHKVVQKVREIDPNDYEFHATLREILGVVQSDKDRVVVVLDNIDRLPKKEIKEYWALVRSIFSRTHGEIGADKNADITAIVPYDRKLIEANVNEEVEEEPKSSGLSSLASRELFSKTFDEVLTVAPPVLSNAREFFFEKLEEALPKQVSSDDRFRAYRIFCELLNIEGGITTPRQIVSFVNDLSGLYELHDGKFKLPTVAAYIAHQDILTESPGILNTSGGLNQKIADLASDDLLVQNLAAMVFNVEESLAFQILLDDEVAKAIIADEAEPLLELSKAPGFDDRVDDVIQDNIDEWRSTGELGTAISNVSKMLESYAGDAKDHVASSMLRGFSKVESISIPEDEYAPYLPVFSMARKPDLRATVTHFINAIFEDIRQSETHSFKDGRNLATFLTEIKEILYPLDGVDDLLTAIGNVTPPSSAEFMFGLSSSLSPAEFRLEHFASATLSIAEDSDYLEQQCVQYPSLAIPALHQFSLKNLIEDDKWLSIANACLDALKSDEAEEGDVEKLIEIVVMTWRKVKEDRRDEIELGAALTEGQFFKNLGDGSSSGSRSAQANLLFLSQKKLGEALADPTTLQANGARTPDTSDAFVAFKEILEGSASIEDEQAAQISGIAIEARRANLWIKFAKENPGHLAVSQIVHKMFESDTPPYLKLSAILSSFEYLEGIFDSESLSDVLRKYASRYREDEIKKLGVDDLPQGFVAATHAVGDGHWGALHDHVDQLLKSVEQDAWSVHIENMDSTVAVLVEKLGSSGCELEGGRFRTPFIKVIKDVLAGHIDITARNAALDTLLSAVNEDYHDDIFRTLREEISNVTASSLHRGMQLFPGTIRMIAQRGDRIMKAEKDSVIRHLLVPALEGRNEPALRVFIGMGFTKLKDYQNAAEASTTSMLEGAWKGFKENETDRDLIRDVSEALYGKRKTKSIFDPTFWLPTRD